MNWQTKKLPKKAPNKHILNSCSSNSSAQSYNGSTSTPGFNTFSDGQDMMQSPQRNQMIRQKNGYQSQNEQNSQEYLNTLYGNKANHILFSFNNSSFKQSQQTSQQKSTAQFNQSPNQSIYTFKQQNNSNLKNSACSSALFSGFNSFQFFEQKDPYSFYSSNCSIGPSNSLWMSDVSYTNDKNSPIFQDNQDSYESEQLRKDTEKQKIQFQGLPEAQSRNQTNNNVDKDMLKQDNKEYQIQKQKENQSFVNLSDNKTLKNSIIYEVQSKFEIQQHSQLSVDVQKSNSVTQKSMQSSFINVRNEIYSEPIHVINTFQQEIRGQQQNYSVNSENTLIDDLISHQSIETSQQTQIENKKNQNNQTQNKNHKNTPQTKSINGDLANGKLRFDKFNSRQFCINKSKQKNQQNKFKSFFKIKHDKKNNLELQTGRNPNQLIQNQKLEIEQRVQMQRQTKLKQQEQNRLMKQKEQQKKQKQKFKPKFQFKKKTFNFKPLLQNKFNQQNTSDDQNSESLYESSVKQITSDQIRSISKQIQEKSEKTYLFNKPSKSKNQMFSSRLGLKFSNVSKNNRITTSNVVNSTTNLSTNNIRENKTDKKQFKFQPRERNFVFKIKKQQKQQKKINLQENNQNRDKYQINYQQKQLVQIKQKRNFQFNNRFSGQSNKQIHQKEYSSQHHKSLIKGKQPSFKPQQFNLRNSRAKQNSFYINQKPSNSIPDRENIVQQNYSQQLNFQQNQSKNQKYDQFDQKYGKQSKKTQKTFQNFEFQSKNRQSSKFKFQIKRKQNKQINYSKKFQDTSNKQSTQRDSFKNHINQPNNHFNYQQTNSLSCLNQEKKQKTIEKQHKELKLNFSKRTSSFTPKISQRQNRFISSINIKRQQNQENIQTKSKLKQSFFSKSPQTIQKKGINHKENNRNPSNAAEHQINDNLSTHKRDYSSSGSFLSITSVSTEQYVRQIEEMIFNVQQLRKKVEKNRDDHRRIKREYDSLQKEINQTLPKERLKNLLTSKYI